MGLYAELHPEIADRTALIEGHTGSACASYPYADHDWGAMSADDFLARLAADRVGAARH